MKRPPRLSPLERWRRRPVPFTENLVGLVDVPPFTPVAMRSPMDDVPAGKAEEYVNNGHPAGDCVRASVATILGLDLEEVPHFVQYIEHPAGTDRSLWYWALVGFCHAHGWRVDWTEKPPRGWSMADGKSPRGHTHVVVAYNGQVVHDPHPTSDGLVSTAGYFAFEKAAASPADQDAMAGHLYDERGGAPWPGCG